MTTDRANSGESRFYRNRVLNLDRRVIQTGRIAVRKRAHKLASELARRTNDERTHVSKGTLCEIALPFEAGRDADGAPKNAAHYQMIRANNPDIDFESLNARVEATAARLRDLNIVEEQRRARCDGDDSSPQLALTRYRAVNAYLDRAEDFNQPKSRAPRRLAKYGRMAPKAMHLALKVFNRVFQSAARRKRGADRCVTGALLWPRWPRHAG